MYFVRPIVQSVTHVQVYGYCNDFYDSQQVETYLNVILVFVSTCPCLILDQVTIMMYTIIKIEKETVNHVLYETHCPFYKAHTVNYKQYSMTFVIANR